MKQILYYSKENGKIPVRDFLIDLEKKNTSLMLKIRSKIQLLSLGLLGENDVKFIQDKIYELRVRDGNNISRVFYFTYTGENIVLLDAIIKKDQKLKQTDIHRALEYKNDFIKRFW